MQSCTERLILKATKLSNKWLQLTWKTQGFKWLSFATQPLEFPHMILCCALTNFAFTKMTKKHTSKVTIVRNCSKCFVLDFRKRYVWGSIHCKKKNFKENPTILSWRGKEARSSSQAEQSKNTTCLCGECNIALNRLSQARSVRFYKRQREREGAREREWDDC